MCMDAQDILDSCGKPNSPGLKSTLYYIPIEEVVSDPLTKDQTAASPVYGDDLVIENDFTLTTDSGKGYWRTIPIILYTDGAGTDDMIGEIGGKSFENRVVFTVRGKTKESLKFAKEAANGKYIMGYIDRDGQQHIVGKKDDYCVTESIAITTGDGPATRKGATYSVMASSGFPALIYEGAFNTTPNP